MTSRPLHAVLLPPQAEGGLMAEALAAALDGTGPAILPLDPAMPKARLDAIIAAFAPTAIETIDGFQRLASPGVADDVAVVLATSGSTGMPKGAELSATALLASARASLTRLGAVPGERWLCCLPTHHISGLGVLVRSLITGSTPVMTSRLSADVVAATSAAYVSLVPTQLRRLLDARAPLDRFRSILLGGAAIPAGMLDEARAVGARVVTTYGMTETCGGCVYDAVPLDGVEVAGDAEGRLRIRGPMLFSRYRLAPELTRAALDDGWFNTFDLGELGLDGRLILRGRADDTINSGGEKVIASEVERVLRHHPGVADAVVVGTADPVWGERVTALVVAADPARPPGLDEVREHVAGSLPRYAAPQALVLVPEIPMLASGKPDRQLMKRIAAGTSQ